MKSSKSSYIYFKVELDISNVEFHLNFQTIKWQKMNRIQHC